MSGVRAEVDGYQLVESENGSWLIRTPDGRELWVTTGNKGKVYEEFLKDPEGVCAEHCD